MTGGPRTGVARKYIRSKVSLMSLPEPWTRSAFVGHMRSTGIGVVASDAFATEATPPEAVRVCLGGPPDRAAVRNALEFMAHALAESPAMASTYL